MASFTGVGDTTDLQLTRKGEIASIALSGTYNMEIALQREEGSPGSGAWETLKTWDTADATVAYDWSAQREQEHLRLIVLVDTSGTCTATITDGTGVPEFVLVPNANTNILAKNSGKPHFVANVSADRTFYLPAPEPGLNFKFIATVGAADGHDWIFDTGAAAYYFVGGVGWIDDAPAANGVPSDGDSNSLLQVNVPEGGTWVEMWCDGTIWYVTGLVVAGATPAFDDA